MLGIFIALSPGVNFINVFMCNFHACRSQKRKKLLELTVFLRFQDLCVAGNCGNQAFPEMPEVSSTA